MGLALAKMPEIRWMIRVRDSQLIAEGVVPRASSIPTLLRKVHSIHGVRATRHHVAERRFKDAPRAVVSTGLSAMIACFECGKPIDGKPVKLRLGCRVHYLCRSSCERSYRERHVRVPTALKTG